MILSMLIISVMPLQVFAKENTNEILGNASETDSVIGNDFLGITINEQDLNTKYNTLWDQLNQNGFGEHYTLSFPETKGYSLNAVQVFEDTYGDISDFLEMNSPEVPESFSASDMISQGIGIRDSIYTDVKESDLYKTVFSQMDLSAVWDKASIGLPSASTLFTNSFATDFSSVGELEKAENQEYLAGIQEGALELFTESGGMLSESNKNSFWNAVGEMRDILDSEGDLEDVFDKLK